MKYLHLDNPAGPDGRFNVGDDIQVQAAMRIIPQCDGYLARHQLPTYRGDQARIILNGWFMHEPLHWPPSRDLLPLMISFHMNPQPAKVMFDRGRDFFERHAPIGCRDFQTLEIFRQAGIAADYSGCLTLTLQRQDYLQDTGTERQGVYAVDVLYKLRKVGGCRSRLLCALGLDSAEEKRRQAVETRILDRLVDGLERDAVEQVYHSRQAVTDSPQMRHHAARQVLGLYANAKLVLTSRIHCALPCLAFGTPVIFVDGALGEPSERARLRGIIDLMPVLEVDEHGNCDFKKLERAMTPKAEEERAARIAEIQKGLIDRCRDYCGAGM